MTECKPGKRGQVKQEIGLKISKRGSWGKERSIAMTEKLVSAIDRDTAKSKKRSAAKLERQKRKALKGDQYLAA